MPVAELKSKYVQLENANKFLKWENEKMSWTQTLTKLEPASLVNVTSLVCSKNIENRKLIIEV